MSKIPKQTLFVKKLYKLDYFSVEVACVVCVLFSSQTASSVDVLQGVPTDIPEIAFTHLNCCIFREIVWSLQIAKEICDSIEK